MTATRATAASFDPRSADYLRDPQRVVQDLLDDTPVFFCEPLNAYAVLRYDDVRRVLDDDETYSNHTLKAMPVRAELRDRIPESWQHAGAVIHGRQLNNLDAPEHTVERRALRQTFTHKQVDLVKPHIGAIADELIDGLIERGSCDLMQDFAMRLTVRVVGEMIGISADMLATFLAWTHNGISLASPIHLRPEDVTMPDDELVLAYERVHAAYETYSKVVGDRRGRPGGDLTSAMLALTDDGRPLLTDDQVVGHVLDLVAAGTDTTSLLITNMVRFFTESPGELDVVLDEPALWANAVREGLRRSSVVTQLLRINQRDVEIGGIEIPCGSTVAISLASANADPARFPDPLRFDVRRRNASDTLAFGHGRHYCVGAPLAIPEARIALETLYRRLPSLKADLEQPLVFKPSLIMRRFTSQRVTW
jgi:cytochrome P450